MSAVEDEVVGDLKVTLAWRQLSVEDINHVIRLADRVHPELPESEAIFAERVRLYPEGCLALVEGDKFYGYAISHPIRHRQPPALNSFLEEIAADANQYYIHDLAILPKVRGRGLAQQCIDKLIAIGQHFPTTCLVSVYDTAPFWSRFGFERVEINEALREKLLEYCEDAVYMERKN
jgi:ribosomal protein S18 acetylase RimI-like enzyme